MEKYFEINEQNNNIFCKLYYEKGTPIKRMILFGHGFAGHKDNAAARRFAEKVLAKHKDTATVVFDWPCHGKDVKKKLTLDDCMSYLSIISEYLKKEYEPEGLYAYATSFGGYLILKYISENGNPFEKMVFRCPAIDMYGTFAHTIMQPGNMEMLKKGKTVAAGFDRKVDITMNFIQELIDSDIRERDYLDYADNIMIIHGTKDEIVPYDIVQEFCENNVIEFYPMEGADHRFQNQQHMDLATKMVMEFFENRV